jgi:rhodanese-related sulfurtransferase
MKIMSTHELSERLEAGPLALFDVRGDVAYEQGHIPGAKTAPLGSLVFRVAHVMNPESTVVVYSAGGDCRLGAEAAERLENLGLRNVHWYEAGLEGWRQSGRTVEASAHAKLITQGPVQDVRPLVVDRERAYGGAFRGPPADVEGAGG